MIQGDELSLWLFGQAGYELGGHIAAMEPDMSSDLLDCVKVVCIGSVWKSWPFMKDAFMQEVKKRCTKIKSIQLVRKFIILIFIQCSPLNPTYLGRNN